jgi:hypothetical protein
LVLQPARLQDCRSDKLRANVSFAEAVFVHAARTKLQRPSASYWSSS